MPKIVDRVERRTTIATAAADVIAEAGIEAATMKAVASGAGVTTGAVTHYCAAVSSVDAIGDAASVDPQDWPIARQRRVLERLVTALDAPTGEARR